MNVIKLIMLRNITIERPLKRVSGHVCSKMIPIEYSKPRATKNMCPAHRYRIEYINGVRLLPMTA
jgi:hypothetical protein